MDRELLSCVGKRIPIETYFPGNKGQKIEKSIQRNQKVPLEDNDTDNQGGNKQQIERQRRKRLGKRRRKQENQNQERSKTMTTTTNHDQTPKATRMDVDSSPGASSGGSGRPKLSKGNQELFELMTTYMDDKFEKMGEGLGAVRKEVKHNSEVIKDLSQEVNKNKDDIERISSQSRDLKKKNGHGVESDVEKIVQKVIEKRADRETSGENGASSDSAQYWFARRCVRCWPVRGCTRQELLSSVGKFFAEKLRIPSTTLGVDDISDVRKLHPKIRRHRGRESNEEQVRDEVLVVLRDVGDRDMVFRHAVNLADWREGRHPNSIGIRMHVPTHLMGKFLTFQQHGYSLRAKYGQGLKRHVRFEDSEEEIVMDVRLPSGEEWMRVDYQFALEETRITKKNKTISARGRLRRNLL